MHPVLTAELAEEQRHQLLQEAASARTAAAAGAGRRRVTHDTSSGDAPQLRLRALDPTDHAHVAALFGRLSPRSRHLRFLAPMVSLTARSLRHLASLDHEHHEAIGMFDRGALVGATHYFRSADEPARAEISVEVADSHQRRGVGARLLTELARLAGQRGITQLTATALREDTAVRVPEDLAAGR